MEIFLESKDKQAHEKFTIWKENYPEGFVISIRGKENPMLHHGNCYHLIWKSRPDYRMTNKTKVCSLDRKELEEWVRNEIARKLEICSHCKV